MKLSVINQENIELSIDLKETISKIEQFLNEGHKNYTFNKGVVLVSESYSSRTKKDEPKINIQLLHSNSTETEIYTATIHKDELEIDFGDYMDSVSTKYILDTYKDYRITVRNELVN